MNKPSRLSLFKRKNSQKTPPANNGSQENAASSSASVPSFSDTSTTPSVQQQQQQSNNNVLNNVMTISTTNGVVGREFHQDQQQQHTPTLSLNLNQTLLSTSKNSSPAVSPRDVVTASSSQKRPSTAVPSLSLSTTATTIPTTTNHITRFAYTTPTMAPSSPQYILVPAHHVQNQTCSSPVVGVTQQTSLIQQQQPHTPPLK